jgi:hypothetical protein
LRAANEGTTAVKNSLDRFKEPEDELLDVLRSRLDPSVLAKCSSLRRALAPDNDALQGEAVALRKIIDAINSVLDPEGRALKLMAGLDERTRSPRIKRETIKLLIGEVLDSRKKDDDLLDRRKKSDELGLGTRRVEQLETLLTRILAVKLSLVSDVRTQAIAEATAPDGPTLLPSHRIADPTVRSRPVFAQYCNPELFALAGLHDIAKSPVRMHRLLTSATRLALLITDDLVIFPATYLWEVSAFPTFLASAGPVLAAGHLAFVSQTADLEIVRDLKAYEYRADTDNAYERSSPLRRIPSGLVWRPRVGVPTAAAIGNDWRTSIEAGVGPLGRVSEAIVSRTTPRRRTTARVSIVDVPERLEGRAFIGRFARAVAGVEFTPAEAAAIDLFLSNAYLRSYINDLNATIMVDFTVADFSCGLSTTGRDGGPGVVSIRPLLLGLERLGLDRFVLERCSWKEFLQIRASPELPLVVDAIAYHPGVELTQRALARARHPASQAQSVDDVARTLSHIARAMSQLEGIVSTPNSA